MGCVCTLVVQFVNNWSVSILFQVPNLKPVTRWVEVLSTELRYSENVISSLKADVAIQAPEHQPAEEQKFLNIKVFFDVTLCCCVSSFWLLKGSLCCHPQGKAVQKDKKTGLLDPEYEGKVQYPLKHQEPLTNDPLSHPRKCEPSATLLWEPPVSQKNTWKLLYEKVMAVSTRTCYTVCK